MKQYTKVTETFNAMQFDGRNGGVLVKSFPNAPWMTNGTVDSIQIGDRRGPIQLEKGDWVVQDVSGFARYTDGDFKASFTEIPKL